MMVAVAVVVLAAVGANDYNYDHTGYTNFSLDFATSSECSACKCQDCKAKYDGAINVINALTASVKEMTSNRGVIPSKRIPYPYTPPEIKAQASRVWLYEYPSSFKLISYHHSNLRRAGDSQVMEDMKLQGSVPASLFSLYQLQTIILHALLHSCFDIHHTDMNSGLAYITQTRSSVSYLHWAPTRKLMETPHLQGRNHYPPSHIPHLALGVGIHKDAGGLTILAQDDIGWLEVETLSREKLASRLTLTADAASVGPPLLPLEATAEEHNITIDNPSIASKEEEKVEPVSSRERKNYPFEGFNISNEALKKLTQLINDYSEWIADGLLKHHGDRKQNDEHYKLNESSLGLDMFDFVVAHPGMKNWFYLMSQPQTFWNDEV
ncbi:hypothetical protein BC332_16284 [Capsicum chinense]|nr:hypothetical protein BC332_16284 [Capsicum chinense]